MVALAGPPRPWPRTLREDSDGHHQGIAPNAGLPGQMNMTSPVTRVRYTTSFEFEEVNYAHRESESGTGNQVGGKLLERDQPRRGDRREGREGAVPSGGRPGVQEPLRCRDRHHLPGLQRLEVLERRCWGCLRDGESHPNRGYKQRGGWLRRRGSGPARRFGTRADLRFCRPEVRRTSRDRQIPPGAQPTGRRPSSAVLRCLPRQLYNSSGPVGRYLPSGSLARTVRDQGRITTYQIRNPSSGRLLNGACPSLGPYPLPIPLISRGSWR